MIVAGGCTGSEPRAAPPPVVATELTGTDTVVLVGAGDIAECDAQGDEQTAALLDSIPGTVFTAGDNAYHDGATAEFNGCYSPSWDGFARAPDPTIMP